MNASAYPEAIAVGHLCYDHLCAVDGYPPEDTSKHIEEAMNQPGGAASQAIAAFARLGGRAGYLGALGDDAAGSYLRESLRAEGIDDRRLRIVPGGRSSFSFVVSNRLNASRTLMSYHDRLPPIDFSDPDVVDYIAHARAVHLDGTMYENALGAARTARAHGVLVSLDGCSMQKDNEKNRALAALADLLIMNEVYPCRLMETGDREAALLKIAGLGARVVISTSGAKGCLAVVKGRIVRFPAYRITPVDTTGAGDVFHGAFLFAYLRGEPLAACVRFASAVAAINCLTLGGRDGIPDLSKTRAFMAEHEFAFPQ